MDLALNSPPATLRIRARGAALAALLLASVVTSGCSSTPDKFYDGPDLPQGEVAVLDWSDCGVSCHVEVDGKAMPRNALFLTGRFPIEKITLRPGRHVIDYKGTFGYSGAMYTRHFYSISHSATLDMQPGHHYVIRHERTSGWGVGNVSDFLWIQDQTTGAILEGEPPRHRTELVARTDQVKRAAVADKRFQLLDARAHCGDARAQVGLGLHYFAGLQPVEQDLRRAYFWYGLAARTDPSAAKLQQKIRAQLSAADLAQGDQLIASFRLQPCPAEEGANEK